MSEKQVRRLTTAKKKKPRFPIKAAAMLSAVILTAVVAVIFIATKSSYENKQKWSKPPEVTKNTPDTSSPDTAPPETTAPETTAPETTAPLDPNRVSSIELDRYELNLSIGEKEMPMVTMYPREAPNQAEIWESSNESVATVSKYGNVTAIGVGECVVKVTSEDNPNVFAEVKVKVASKSGVNLTYINGILIANKTYALPPDYNPGTDPTAAAALDEMFKAASRDGISLWIASGFRSYERQQTLYNNYVAADGKAEADRYSARPGHSEHQTGLAFDLNSLDVSFGQTPEGVWLKNNCYKYGFIIRYPQEKEAVTGYMYEPWHVRYLGKDIAAAVYNSGKCLEEYLGITSQYSN